MTEIFAEVRTSNWTDVAVPGFTGKAAMLDDNIRMSATLSWAGKSRVAPGVLGLVNGRPVRVITAGPSDYSDKITTMTVEFTD